MKHLRTGVIFFILCGCKSFGGHFFDEDYYEKTTQIKFPNNYRIIATADNGEFLTITILSIDKSTCKDFIRENNFQPVDHKFSLMLMGLNLLDSSFSQIRNSRNLLGRYVGKVPGKVGWTYLIDTTEGKLYCEIDYPDRAGN